MRLWYVRRGISWAPLLTCCAAALAFAGLTNVWPETASLSRLFALALCASAAAFAFDEAAGAVVAVTPRGAGWRRTNRLALMMVPLVSWLLFLALLPAEASSEVGAWVLVGIVSTTVAVGAAGLLSRHGMGSPGSAVSACVAGLVLVPLVIGPLTGWDGVLPQQGLSAGAAAFWCGLGSLGLALVGWGVRPGLR